MVSRSLTLFLVLTGVVTLASGQTVLDVSMLGTGNLDAQLAERRAELDAERAEKLALEQELLALPELERGLESTLARDVRALYRLRRGGLLPMAEGLESLMGHASRVAHFERMTRRTLARLTESQRGSAR
ncbi:MAG: hypothetical protein JWN04_3248, partial [Myxococcaceae bacterium]|nr:hypothetical protein [Myxococcaceae bacterium]